MKRVYALYRVSTAKQVDHVACGNTTKDARRRVPPGRGSRAVHRSAAPLFSARRSDPPAAQHLEGARAPLILELAELLRLSGDAVRSCEHRHGDGIRWDLSHRPVLRDSVPAPHSFDLQSAVFPRGRYEVPIRAALAVLAVLAIIGTCPDCPRAFPDLSGLFDLQSADFLCSFIR